MMTSAGTTWLKGTGETSVRPTSSMAVPTGRRVAAKTAGQRGRINRSTQASRGTTISITRANRSTSIWRRAIARGSAAVS